MKKHILTIGFGVLIGTLLYQTPKAIILNDGDLIMFAVFGIVSAFLIGVGLFTEPSLNKPKETESKK